jgi:transcriptional regulator with XRE-family HTH domain
MTFHDNIRNFRKFRGITQEQLAEAVGRSKAVVSNWEHGINSPDLDTRMALCRIFSVTPNQFFGWEENPDYIAWLENTKQLEKELDNMKKERDEMDKRIREYSKRISAAKKD